MQFPQLGGDNWSKLLRQSSINTDRQTSPLSNPQQPRLKMPSLASWFIQTIWVIRCYRKLNSLEFGSALDLQDVVRLSYSVVSFDYNKSSQSYSVSRDKLWTNFLHTFVQPIHTIMLLRQKNYTMSLSACMRATYSGLIFNNGRAYYRHRIG